MHRNRAPAPWELFLVDGIGPFFRDLPPGRINWSKIPFHLLERGGDLEVERLEAVTRDFDAYCARVSAAGFNAITLDDLAHVTDAPFYPSELRRKIAHYRRYYETWFALARTCGLQVYLTTDVMFHHPSLDEALGGGWKETIRFLRTAAESVLDDFPDVAGLICRVGESDGLDVRGDFRSRLMIRTPAQARRFLSEVLPVFEKRDRRLIFRTWSVGAYRLGDLIWNRDTYDAVFDAFDSPALVVSLKHGDSDFFRFLPLNRNIFRGRHRKLVEFQARREYEGFGEFPSYIGRDVEELRERLSTEPALVGISVWCQTGGWSAFRRRTFLEPAGIWSEINACSVVRQFKEGLSADGAARAFHLERGAPGRWDRFIELLQLSDEVIKELLYVEEFARRKLFFRRLRVPPLLTVYWDHLIVTRPVRAVMRRFVLSPTEQIAQGRAAMLKLDRMARLAEELGLPVQDIEFQRDTFELIQAARRYYFGPDPDSAREALAGLRARYQQKHPNGFHVLLDAGPVRRSGVWTRRLLRLLFREQRGYRWVDHVFTIRLLGWIYPVLRRFHRRFLPEMARTHAMGVDAIFK